MVGIEGGAALINEYIYAVYILLLHWEEKILKKTVAHVSGKKKPSVCDSSPPFMVQTNAKCLSCDTLTRDDETEAEAASTQR